MKSAEPKSQCIATSEKKRKGRKRGRKPKKKDFGDIRLGYLLRYHAPVELAVIIDSTKGKSAPSADLIEQIGYLSGNKFFKTAMFRRALIDYRNNGLQGKIAFGRRGKVKS